MFNAVLDYIRSGGLVIVGLYFPNFTSDEVFNNFFAYFDLPWKRGDYCLTTFQFGRPSTLPTGVDPKMLPCSV